jgi:hypothetical protein
VPLRKTLLLINWGGEIAKELKHITAVIILFTISIYYGILHACTYKLTKHAMFCLETSEGGTSHR